MDIRFSSAFKKYIIYFDDVKFNVNNSTIYYYDDAILEFMDYTYDAIHNSKTGIHGFRNVELGF